jgi:Ca2+-binding EF-hand superfamily protein
MSTQEVENVVEHHEEPQDVPEVENNEEVNQEVEQEVEQEVVNDNQEHQDINVPSQELLSPDVEPAQEEEQDEAKAYFDLFNSFDPEKTGKIKAEKLYEIASILGKDSRNVDEVLKQNRVGKDASINFETYQQFIAELDRPNVSILDSRQSTRSQRVIITPDPKVIEFIKLLYAFQLKCEKEGKYGEARLAQEKIEDIKVKEILRQENNIRSFQEEELAQVESAQTEQFIEFNKVWDSYMGDYEATALASLEKLKEKHISEVEDLNERLKSELAFTFKSSSQLLELRKKEVNLAKMKKYSEAEKIQMQADTLEQVEKYNNERQIAEIIEKKILALRKQQQRGLTVLLKRIQKDRNQQLKNREHDSSKLVLKNKNLITELLAKHSTEAKNAIEVIRNNFAVSSSINLQARKTNSGSVGKRDSINKSTLNNESFSKAEADVL